MSVTSTSPVVFLAASAAGTLIGGPVGDRIGRKPVIWGSIASLTARFSCQRHLEFSSLCLFPILQLPIWRRFAGCWIQFRLA
jgi:MFS family permease